MKQGWRLDSWRPRLELLLQPPVIGAFIIFATFVVKEAIRDHVKDKLDRVNSAEVAFATRGDTLLTWINLAAIEGQLTTITSAAPQHFNHPGDKQFVKIEQL